MIQFFQRKKFGLFFRMEAFFVILAFLTTLISPPVKAHAQSVLELPLPGSMVTVSAGFVPPMLKGIKVDLQQPFQFDFILDSGNADLEPESLREEANQLIRYFLASLTIPEEDLWVNLSPYEKDRIISPEFGMTEMGRDLLAQDYILKQLTASLMYPEEELGKNFWNRVYERASQLYGTTDIPVNTFNKVWIVPDKAVVYENGDIAFILKSHLKVMLEKDYIALKHNLEDEKIGADPLKKRDVEELSGVSAEIVREVIVPEIEKEVNNGRNFARLRQIYHSLILAKWYKERIKASLLNQVYSDQKIVNGIDLSDKAAKEKIYNQYLKAFKKGVFNYIKEDYDIQTQQIIPRKYFAGGMELRVPLEIETDPEQLAKADITGKFRWIQGVYRRPRSSPRAVNDFIRRRFQEGRVRAGEPIILEDGSRRKAYYVDDLLKSMGQLGHIGFIEKDENGRPIKGGQEVVFLDSKYGIDEAVRRHEGFKVSRWGQKRKSLGLSPEQMRQWLKGHLGEAVAFLREVDQEANQRYPMESIYAQAEKTGDLPSNEAIAQTYTQPEDFKDLNLAAGRWGIGRPTTQGVMPKEAVYSVKAQKSFDDIVIEELAKQRGLSVDDLEADFERLTAMHEERLKYSGYIAPDTDPTAHKMHEIFDRLVAVYKTKTNEPPGRLHIVDANTVNAFMFRKRTDVYFFKGFYETLYDISQRMGVPLTEDIIAFILAHELSHLLQHTSYEGLEMRDFYEETSPYLLQMIKNSEYDADMQALELMDKAGYSVFGAVDALTFFEFIKNASQAENVLSSHPYVRLRKHRLSQIILAQKTMVFTHVKAPRIPMAGNGRMKSRDVDYRYLLDKSEDELLDMARNAESIAALDELVGMMVVRKRMNALKSLVNENQLKTSFLRHIYFQAVFEAIVTSSGMKMMPGSINYSDMKSAAAIYDFGIEIEEKNVLSESAETFEESVGEIVDEINESLSYSTIENVVAAKNRLQRLFPVVRRRAERLNHEDFDDFLLPFEEVQDLIPIFARKKADELIASSRKRKKIPANRRLIDGAIKDPKRLISAFLYANYLGQQPFVEFGIPTTDVRVKLQRRKNSLYLENPAYRSVQSAQDRRNLQNIVLLHYVLGKARSGVFNDSLNSEFPGIDKFLKVDPQIARELFEKYNNLMATKYPKPVAIRLAKKRVQDYLGVRLSTADSSDTPGGFVREFFSIQKRIQSDYAGAPEGLAAYRTQKINEFINNHPLIAFIRKAINEYGDRIPSTSMREFNEEVDRLRANNIASYYTERKISDILIDIANIYVQEPRREVRASEVFSNETHLDYYHTRKETVYHSFRSLLALPDWAVSDYLKRHSHLIRDALKQGVSIGEIFEFMKTRLAYEDRRRIFESLFLTYGAQPDYLMDFFRTELNNNPKKIILWFLGMFSKKDALMLIDQLSRSTLNKKIKKSGTSELRDLTIALFEYLYSQTSKNFHADKETVKVYLDLIQMRMDESGRSEDEDYVRQEVYKALRVLSAAVDLRLEVSRPKGFSADGTPDFKSEKTSIAPQFPKEIFRDRYAHFESNFSLHNFGWNDGEATSQSIFVTYLTELSIDQLKALLRQRRQYIESQVDVEYRDEVFSVAGLNDFFSNLIAFIMLKKLHNPDWENTKNRIARLDDLIKIELTFSKERKKRGVEILSADVKLEKKQDEINAIPFEVIRDNCVGVCMPSSGFDLIWEFYVTSNKLQHRFPEIMPLLQNPNVFHEASYNSLGYLSRHKWGQKVSYRQIIKKFFFDSSVYSKLFNAYVEAEGKGYVYGRYKPLDERLKWIEQVLPNRSIIKDGVIDLWETDIFPEIIEGLPALVQLTRKIFSASKDLNNMWRLLGEMDDDVGRLQRLQEEIHLPPERIKELLDFYTKIIPLTFSAQKIARYGATAYMLWSQLPESVHLGLSEHLEALTKFMPEPSLLRDELLIKISNRFLRRPEDVSAVSDKFYTNNLLSRNRDLRTEDFIADTLMHLFGAAKIEDRRDILLWISGANDKPSFVRKIEDEYNIDFSTLPGDVKFLPSTIRGKFLEGFMLGDNGVLDPQSDADKDVMLDFLSKLFSYMFLQGTKITDPGLQTLLLKVFLAVMDTYPPYRRVQIIKALANLRARRDFGKTGIGERLAVLFGALGPVGMKVAQYLSENETLVPDPKIRSSLGVLRHKAPEITKISAISLLENEIPFAEVMVQEIGRPVGIASIKQVNRGRWLDIEKLAEKVISQSSRSEADEVRDKMRGFNAGKIPLSEMIPFLVEKARQNGVNLKDAGVNVVYKIRRPNIESTIGLDFEALEAAARELRETQYKGESLNVEDLVNTVREWVELEMNFRKEAEFHKTLTDLNYTWAENLDAEAGFKIGHPRIFYVTDALIVEEEIPGVPVVNLGARQTRVTVEDVVDAGYDRSEAREVLKRLTALDRREAHILLSLKKAGFPEQDLNRLAQKTLSYNYGKLRELLHEMLLRQIFVDGVFHADLHQGNIMVTPDGKVVMIDRGNVGTLNPAQREGAKIFLKGMLLRDAGLTKEGIDRIFLNAQYPDGEKPVASKMTVKEIQEVLDKGYDLRMTMGMVSLRAVQGAKTTSGGKDFSTFLKAFTQAMWLFPTDLINGMGTLQAMAKYIDMEEAETLQAAREQAKYLDVQNTSEDERNEEVQGDITSILKNIFYEQTEGYFLRSLWRPIVFSMIKRPLGIAVESATRRRGQFDLISLVRTQGRQILEDNIEELAKRQDKPIGDVVLEMASVKLVEQFVEEYVENNVRGRPFGKVLAPVVKPLLPVALVLGRPMTRMYVNAFKKWFDSTGQQYIDDFMPGMTLREGVDRIARLFPGDFGSIKQRFDEEREKVRGNSDFEEPDDPQGGGMGKSGVKRNRSSSSIQERVGREGHRRDFASKQEHVGGIDFNPNLLELQIEGDMAEFNLPVSDANMEQIQIDGLLPVIINIRPVSNLPFILGAVESGERQLTKI